MLTCSVPVTLSQCGVVNRSYAIISTPNCSDSKAEYNWVSKLHGARGLSISRNKYIQCITNWHHPLLRFIQMLIDDANIGPAADIWYYKCSPFLFITLPPFVHAAHIQVHFVYFSVTCRSCGVILFIMLMGSPPYSKPNEVGWQLAVVSIPLPAAAIFGIHDSYSCLSAWLVVFTTEKAPIWSVLGGAHERFCWDRTDCVWCCWWVYYWPDLWFAFALLDRLLFHWFVVACVALLNDIFEVDISARMSLDNIARHPYVLCARCMLNLWSAKSILETNRCVMMIFTGIWMLHAHSFRW